MLYLKYITLQFLQHNFSLFHNNMTRKYCAHSFAPHLPQNRKMKIFDCEVSTYLLDMDIINARRQLVCLWMPNRGENHFRTLPSVLHQNSVILLIRKHLGNSIVQFKKDTSVLCVYFASMHFFNSVSNVHF